MCKALHPVGCDQYCILDADTAEILDVDAGFDGDDHARGEDGFVRFSEAGWLVDFEAEAVAGGMDEVLVEFVFAEGRDGGGVDLATTAAGADGVEGG